MHNQIQRSRVVTLVDPTKRELSIGYPPLLHAKHLTYPVLFGRGHPQVDGATQVDLLHSQLMVPPTATCGAVRHSVTQPKLQDIPGEHAQGWEGERPGITPFVLRVGQFFLKPLLAHVLEPKWDEMHKHVNQPGINEDPTPLPAKHYRDIYPVNRRIGTLMLR